MARSEGFTLPELLIVVALLASLAGLSLGPTTEVLARQRLEAATRRLLQGLDRGRLAAEHGGRPCALSLDARGWHAPESGGLAGCPGVGVSLQEDVAEGGALRLEHNLPAAVRFSANGLVLDGGTLVLSHPGTSLERCVVVSLPLGVVRVGRYGNGACEPDPTL